MVQVGGQREQLIALPGFAWIFMNVFDAIDAHPWVAAPLSDVDRAGFIEAVAATWAQLDPDEYPFTKAVPNQMRDHDDHEQFLAGIRAI